MMNVGLSVTEHATGYPSRVLAREGGKHIYDVVANSNTDNGNLVAVGDMIDIQNFAEAAVKTFAGKIVCKMPNGDWLVEVKDPGDACLVYTKPLSPYENPAILRSEKSMYNKQGDIMRCYELAKGDNFQVNEAAFSGTPAKGKEIKSVAAKKMVVSA